MYCIRDYQGSRLHQPSSIPDVLILGQDPAVDQCKRFTVALGFGRTSDSRGNESRNLQDHICSKILPPSGIDARRTLATNPINTYYTDVPIRKLATKHRSPILSAALREGIDVDQYPDKVDDAPLQAISFEHRFRGRTSVSDAERKM